MAVTSSSLKSVEGTLAIRGQDRIRKTYVVHTDNDETSPDNVIIGAQSSTPQAVETLYTYMGQSAYTLSITATQDQPDNFKKWNVTVEGGPLPDEETETNPLSREPVHWVEYLTETQEVSEDTNGDSITNTAGQPFDEIITRDLDLAVLVIQKNVSATSLGSVITQNQSFQHTKNIDATQGAAVGTLKFLGTTAGRPKYENQVPYYETITRILYNVDGHDIKRESKGYKQLVAGDLVNILDEDGQQVSEPQLLDAAGAKLAVAGTPHIQTFVVLRSVAYAGLF